jgi:uncharacterized membrane protein
VLLMLLLLLLLSLLLQAHADPSFARGGFSLNHAVLVIFVSSEGSALMVPLLQDASTAVVKYVRAQLLC